MDFFHGHIVSNPGVPGFFRDHVTLPAANLLPLPETMGLAEATLYEPISIILHSFRYGACSIVKMFHDIMARLDFLPNSPTLMNAGHKV